MPFDIGNDKPLKTDNIIISKDYLYMNRYFLRATRFSVLLACGLLTLFLVVACISSTTRAPMVTFYNGTRVGIINLLDNQATHQHYSSIRIDSFTKKYDVDWDLPAYAEQTLTDALERDGRYAVRNVEKSEYSDWIMMYHDWLKQTDSDVLNPDLSGHLQSLASQEGLDVILVISSFNGPSPHKLGKSPIELEGYGVFSRSVAPLKILPFKSAYSYAQIKISIFKSDPVTLLTTVRSKLKESSIRDFKVPGNAWNLPVTEIDKALPDVQKYTRQTVTRALQVANLIPGPNRMVTEPLDTPSAR
jgi:hypothetical protein